MQTFVAHTGKQAMTLKQAHSPNVVLVDLDLPDIDGEALLLWLVGQGDCGIIVVSGHVDAPSCVMCLELGADDYITKPPHLRELVARIRAVLRRLGERTVLAAEGPDNPVVSVGDFKVDLGLRQVRDAHGRLVDITSTEFATLTALIEAKGKPVSREHLSEVVLRRRWDGHDRSIDQLVFRIRHKLQMDGDDRRFIQSIRNAGYVLSLPRPGDA
jgi:DNA-binding response OmpR family regulator